MALRTVLCSLLILMSVVVSSFAQLKGTNIFVKGSQIVNCEVKEIHAWGMKTDEDVAIIFRVIDSIRTADTMLDDSLQVVVPNLQTRSEGNITIIDFRFAQLTPRVSESFNPIKYSNVRVNVSTSSYNRLGFQLNLTPWFSEFVVCRFDCSLGFKEKYLPFANLNFGGAIGGEYGFDEYTASLLISFGRFTGYATTGQELTEERVYASTSLSRNIGASKQFQLALGIDVFPVALNIYGKQGVVNALFGFGVVL